MAKSHGDAPKSRAWALIEAILQFLDAGVEMPPERMPENFQPTWKKGNCLEVTTTLEDLAILLYGKDWQTQPDKVKTNQRKELSERIGYYLGEFLGICDRISFGQLCHLVDSSIASDILQMIHPALLDYVLSLLSILADSSCQVSITLID
jgi:hypothetical protein